MEVLLMAASKAGVKRLRLIVFWIFLPILLVLIALTVIAAMTGFTPWAPLLVSAVTLLVAGGAFAFVGTPAARREDD